MIHGQRMKTPTIEMIKYNESVSTLRSFSNQNELINSLDDVSKTFVVMCW